MAVALANARALVVVPVRLSADCSPPQPLRQARLVSGRCPIPQVQQQGKGAAAALKRLESQPARQGPPFEDVQMGALLGRSPCSSVFAGTCAGAPVAIKVGPPAAWPSCSHNLRSQSALPDYSPFHKVCPACIWQPHVRQAILRPSDWPGQGEITMNQLLLCEGRLERLKETAGAAPQPSPAQPSLPSLTPSTSTCSRRAAKAKARGKSPRTMAYFVRSMAHERGWYGW